jgi:hypothetical protein
MARWLAWLFLLLLLLPALVCAQLAHPDVLDRQHPLTRGLVSWWPVTTHLSGGATWYDWIGATPLTLTNMGSASGWKGMGSDRFPGALLFDGSDDFATVAKNTNLNLTQGTIAVWAKRTAATGEHVMVSLGDGSADADNFLFLEWADTTDVVRVTVASSTLNVWQADTANTFSIGIWYHFALTVGPNGNALYVNGVAQSLTYNWGASTNTEFLSTVYAAAVTWDVGRLNSVNFPNYCACALTDLRVYNRPLTSAEVGMLATARWPTFGGTLAAEPEPLLPSRIRTRIRATVE